MRSGLYPHIPGPEWVELGSDLTPRPSTGEKVGAGHRLRFPTHKGMVSPGFGVPPPIGKGLGPRVLHSRGEKAEELHSRSPMEARAELPTFLEKGGRPGLQNRVRPSGDGIRAQGRRSRGPVFPCSPESRGDWTLGG